MLDSLRSRWMTIDSYAGQALYSLASNIEEGMALCGVWENGVKAANAIASPAATDEFLGIAFSYYTTPTKAVAVETYVIPSSGNLTVATANTPLNATATGGVLVKDSTSGNTLTYNATPGTGVFQVSGNTFTFNSAQAGDTITITYAFTPTVIQAQQFVGDNYGTFAKPSDVTGTIGLIRRGLIYTSNFNPGFDYSTVNSSTPLKVGANGIIDPAGSGPAIKGYVYELPSADSPFLGLVISAP